MTKSIPDMLDRMLEVVKDTNLQAMAADNKKEEFTKEVKSRLGVTTKNSLQDTHRYEMLRQYAAL